MTDIAQDHPARDPVREEVERWLRAFFAAGIAVPAAAVSGIRRCLGARVGPVTERVTERVAEPVRVVRARVGPVTERVAEPVRVVRSLLELVTGATPPGTTVTAADVAPVPETEAPPSEAAGIADDAPDLPIDEYESLAASHVVARLDNLTPAELRQVRDFEVAHRGRRTVLGRIDQLLAANGTT